MENTNNPIHIARRTVLLQIINDFEKFIIVPQTQHKINLWIRDIKKVSQFANLNLSCGSSFYNVAKSTTGTIVDGEVFKSLSSGTNSYKNVVSVPNKFYHGFLAFNFISYNGSPITWHTDLDTAPSIENYDLYTAMLKEFTHMLGFCSLINADGNSVFGDDFQYFSRYDKFLKNENISQPLLLSENSDGLYNYSFNANLDTHILRPNCSIDGNLSFENTDISNCNTVLWYANSTVKIPIYTPDCFQPGYSFSCLEDQLFPDCDSPFGNNLYFVTSNTITNGVHKRYLKPIERTILTDIGYHLAKTFGSTNTFENFQTYDYNSDAIPMMVFGINDGINQDLTFRFVGNVTDGVQISGASLLENDFQANSFVGLQCLTNGGSVSIETGNTGSNIVLNSSTGGLYLLRYIPTNGSQNGNITYFYVYMNANNDCGTPVSCQNIVNGTFENYLQLPDAPHQIEYACNWKNFTGASTMPANYNHMNSVAWQVGVPSNAFGFQNDNISGNKAYATMGSYYWPNFPNFPAGVQTSNTISQIIRTKLTSPMIAGKKYRVSYQASKSDGSQNNISIALQAFVTSVNFPPNLLNFLSNTQVAQGSLYTNSNTNGTPSFITNTTTWTTVSFDHIAVGGEQYLYIGALNNAPVLNAPAIGGGSFFSNYFYDNVSVKIVEEAVSDTFTFESASTQLVSGSILNNDNFSGTAANITIVQTPNPHPYLSINPNGTVTVAANTPGGTYVVNYFISSTCGISNATTVTVVVQSNVITANGKCMGPAMCVQDSILTTDTPLSPNSTWTEGTTPDAYLINGVPAVMGQLKWFPVGTISPSCLTLNPDGSITVQPNCTTGTPNGLYEFYMKACDSNNLNNCSDLIRVNGYIKPSIEAASYTVFVNQNGLALPSPYNYQYYSGPMNVLENSRLCAQQPSINQVVLTQNNSNGPWQVDFNTGNIYSPTGNYPLGQSTVSYTICENGNPNNCATGQITIYIVN